MAEDRRGHTNALTAAYARLSDPIFPFYSLSLFFFPRSRPLRHASPLLSPLVFNFFCNAGRTGFLAI